MNDWQPSGTVAAARQRNRLLQSAREYFAAQEVMAVDTPALGSATVTDPNIESISAGDAGFLQTSPEYYMKRLLAAGFPDIYAISRVFRDGESGRRHLPEFTLVEWYRLNFDLPAIIADTCALIARLLERPALSTERRIISYRNAFRTHAGLDPATCTVAELSVAANADQRLRDALGDRRDAWLDLVLTLQVIPRFATDALTVLTHYPASQAALARLCPADASVADRFEVFYGSMELANGYVELGDAAEQSARMDHDLRTRQTLGRALVPRDEHLLAALQHGLPDCAGVALGLERLHMLAANTDNIRDVVCFA